MTTSPTIQTNPLDPVFSGVPVVYPQTGMVNPTWNKWFVDLREKVNVINEALASWSGITPVTGIVPGIYGNSTNYPIVTVNQYGMISSITTQSVSGGGGDPMHVTVISADYTVTLSDLPKESANRGMIVSRAANPCTITLDTFANTAIPVGSELQVFQNASGVTTLVGAPNVRLVGPSISGGGQGSSGKAIQIFQDVWAISGDLGYVETENDPYWTSVVSLLHFDGISGSQTFTDQKGIAWTPFNAQTTINSIAALYGSGGFYGAASGNAVAIDATVMGPTSSGDYTVEFYMQSPNVYNGQIALLVNKQNTLNGALRVGFYRNSVDFLVYNYAGTLVNAGTRAIAAAATNTWYYIAICVSGGTTVRAFVNGTLVSTLSVAGGVYQSSITEFGTQSSGADAGFFGYIDEARVTSGVARYTASFTPPTGAFPNG